MKYVLDFLQLKSEALAVNTMNGYVTAISCRYAMVQGSPLSLDTSIKRWLKGLEHTKVIPCMITPTWCLELVIATLARNISNHSDLLPQVPDLTFLLVITSGHRASEMHTLCCKPPYIWFSPAGVTLFTSLEFLPKVSTKANVDCAIYVPAMQTQ